MDDMETTLQRIFASESRRVLATLIRLLGDFDLAEDALQLSLIHISEPTRPERIANPVL